MDSQTYNAKSSYSKLCVHRQSVSDRIREKDSEKSRQAVEVFAPQTFSYAVALDTAADVYNGFVFWSVLTSLGVSVWCK